MFVEPPAAQTHEQAALFPVQQPRPLSRFRGMAFADRMK